MIIATFLPTGVTKRFKDVETASQKTIHSVKRIQWCIETGHKWRSWVFDEE